MSPSPRSRNSASHRHVTSAVWRTTALSLVLLATAEAGVADDLLSGLAQAHEGRSMRATSTFRAGQGREVRSEGRTQGGLEEGSNRDNFRVAPGATHVLMDEEGPGVITHIWLTFLGPEPQDWAKKGSANHQEMLLRIYWDGRERPGVEAPVGDFFANCFGKRSEVVSLPVIVEDADSYNCFWHMPFRKSARVEIVNQSEKPISLLYYNIDWIKKARHRRGHALLPRAVSPGIPGAARDGLRGAGDQGARAITSARSWPCGPAAPPGSARGTRRSPSTARRSRRSGAPARRTISCRPGA